MTYSLHWSDYLIFACWLIVYSLVGIYYRYQIQIHRLWNRLTQKQSGPMQTICQELTSEAIFFADRQLTLFPVTCSVIASFLSAIALLGTATEGYRFGLQFITMLIPYAIAFPLSAEVYLPVFYNLRLKSAQEYLEFRFGKVLRSLVAFVFCIQMWAYIALVLYAPALAFSQVSGLPMWISLVSTGLVTTFYTSMGGLRAVVWTDVIQLILLTSGMIGVVILGIVKVGSFEKIWQVSLDGKRLQSFSFDPNPFQRHTFWTLAIGGTGMVLSIFATNQTQVQRYLACRNLRTARLSLLLNVPFNFIFLAIQLFIGLIMYTYFVGCDPITSKTVGRPDQLLPYFIMVIFDGVPIVRGLFLSVIFAAVLSTVSSGVNSLANVILEDVIHPLFRACGKKRDATNSSPALILSALIGLATIGLAFAYTTMGPLLLQFSFTIFGAIGGPIFAIYTLGILVPCVNTKGGLVGFVCSIIVGLWLSIGSVLNPSSSPTLTLSTENCTHLNSTVNATDSSPFNIYSVSYLYYTPICFIVALVPAIVVSAISGFNSKTPVPSSLLARQAVSFYQRCPCSCISRPQWIRSNLYMDNSRPNHIEIDPPSFEDTLMMTGLSKNPSTREVVG